MIMEIRYSIIAVGEIMNNSIEQSFIVKLALNFHYSQIIDFFEKFWPILWQF